MDELNRIKRLMFEGYLEDYQKQDDEVRSKISKEKRSDFRKSWNKDNEGKTWEEYIYDKVVGVDVKNESVHKIEDINTIEKISKILGKNPSDKTVMDFIKQELDLEDEYQMNIANDIIGYYKVDIDNPKYFDEDDNIVNEVRNKKKLILTENVFKTMIKRVVKEDYDDKDEFHIIFDGTSFIVLDDNTLEIFKSENDEEYHKVFFSSSDIDVCFEKVEKLNEYV